MLYFKYFDLIFLEKYGSSPMDWSLHHMDLYKSHSNIPRIRCNVCRQFGHTAYYCKDQYKPIMCIMCGMEGHNFNYCNKQICLSVSFKLMLI